MFKLPKIHVFILWMGLFPISQAFLREEDEDAYRSSLKIVEVEEDDIQSNKIGQS